MELNSSGSDSDDFAEDMEALKRACLLTNTNNTNLHLPPSKFDSDSSCNSEDEEVIRKMRERFGQEPLNLKPICSLPPADNKDADDDSDDDLLILQAIQRRFSDYTIAPSSSSAVSDSMRKSTGDGGGGCLHKPQVGCIDIDSDKETSNNLYSGRTNTAQGFPDSVDECITTSVSDDDDDDGGGSSSHNQKPGFVSVAENVLASPVRDCSSFPKSALAFLDAIKKNRTCQKYLRSKLMQIEARIEENSKLNECVKTLKGLQVSCRRRTGRALSQKKDDRLQLIEVPKLRANANRRANGKKRGKKKNVIYYGPAENSHVANYRKVLSKIPVSFDRKKWIPEEDENIEKGIKQQFQDTLLQKSYRKKELLHPQLDGLSSDEEGLSGSSNDFDNIIESIGDIHITAENMRVFLPKVNWEQLASMYVAGRSGAECEARWLNFKDPLINKGPWEKLEEKNLLHIVQQKGFSNWIDIAVSLGTNRTPFQCLAHYQRSLNASILRKAWTKDEDDKLRSAVELYGEHDWQLVAAALVGRTGTQCSNRWKKSLNPMRERAGTWTSDETKHLKVAVMLFGAKNWHRIAQYVPGRTKEGCAERWNNCLKPSLKRGGWSECEDSMLEVAAEQNRIKWGKVEWFKVAACIPQRTDNQCMRRFKILFPDKFRLIQEAKKIENVALMSNFVDRETRRPEIGPDDFVSLKMIDLPETRKKKSRSSKRCSKDPGIPPAGELRLSDGSETINFGVTDGMSKKKRGRKVSVDDRLSSRCNIVPPSSDPMFLTITNGEDLGADVGTVTTKNSAPGIQKKRSKRKSDIADTSSRRVPVKKGTRKPSSRDDPASQIVEDQGMEAMKNRKTSKPPLRKGRCSEQRHDVQSNRISDEVVQVFGGEDTISTKKRRKTETRLKKNIDDSSAPIMSSFSVLYGDGVEPVVQNGTTKKKGAVKPRLGSDQASLSVHSSLSSPNISPERILDADNVEALALDNCDDTRYLRCSTPDISDFWNSKTLSIGRRNKLKGVKSSGKSCLNQTPNTESVEYSTLTSFIEKSRKSKKAASSPAKLLKIPNKGGTNTKTSDASENMTVHPSCSTSEIGLNGSPSASVVGAEKRSKRLRVRSKPISDQMSGAEYEEDMTLASYCGISKKRKA